MQSVGIAQCTLLSVAGLMLMQLQDTLLNAFQERCAAARVLVADSTLWVMRAALESASSGPSHLDLTAAAMQLNSSSS